MIPIDAAELALHEIAVAASKAPGDPKEVHEARLGGAGTVLDVLGYVDDFNSTVIDAYRRGSPTATCRATVALRGA